MFFWPGPLDSNGQADPPSMPLAKFLATRGTSEYHEYTRRPQVGMMVQIRLAAVHAINKQVRAFCGVPLSARRCPVRERLTARVMLKDHARAEDDHRP